MTLERRNPLPAGRYYLDVFGPTHIAAFEAYLKSNASSITVENQQLTPASVLNAQPEVMFYLFTLRAPVGWDQVTFGFPNIAGPNIRQQSDTNDVPSVPGFDFGALFTSPAGVMIGLVALAYFFGGSKR
jgi:hypothetical protein